MLAVIFFTYIVKIACSMKPQEIIRMKRNFEFDKIILMEISLDMAVWTTAL